MLDESLCYFECVQVFYLSVLLLLSFPVLTIDELANFRLDFDIIFLQAQCQQR